MKRLTYQIMSEVNHGTAEQPDIRRLFNAVSIECGEAVYEANLSLARKEAYNGEVTVEDIEDPDTEPTAEERIAELEDAMCEMDAMNAQRIAAIEDALCEMDMG